VLAARQMAWGDKGTLFVGSFGLGNVYAIKDNNGKKEVKTILKGLNMPTGLAFKDGALYVIAVDKLIRYDNAEANLDKLGDGKVVYDDMPSYAAHGWKYIAVDKDGWFFLPFGPPFNIGIPPTSVSQIRRVDPKTGNAETWALGVRNSVGGDVDPRTGKYWFTENARDWISDDLPSDKLNMINKIGEHFGYPYCHQGNLPDDKFAQNGERAIDLFAGQTTGQLPGDKRDRHAPGILAARCPEFSGDHIQRHYIITQSRMAGRALARIVDQSLGMGNP
jgi:glucose/arabinose dehydrogenase